MTKFLSTFAFMMMCFMSLQLTGEAALATNQAWPMSTPKPLPIPIPMPNPMPSPTPAATPAPTPAATPASTPLARAVEVRFFGGLTGFDEGAYRAVKSLVASLLSEGVIDQFKTSFWGREGGSSFCIELSPTTNVTAEQITQMLAAIHPRDNSVYQLSSVEKCL